MKPRTKAIIISSALTIGFIWLALAQTNIPPTKIQNLWSMDNTFSRMVFCVVTNGEQRVICVENKTNLLWEVRGDGKFYDYRPVTNGTFIVRPVPAP